MPVHTNTHTHETNFQHRQSFRKKLAEVFHLFAKRPEPQLRKLSLGLTQQYNDILERRNPVLAGKHTQMQTNVCEERGIKSINGRVGLKSRRLHVVWFLMRKFNRFWVVFELYVIGIYYMIFSVSICDQYIWYINEVLFIDIIMENL